MAEIRIGTSGFSFPDWRGVLYPPGLPRSRWFSVYTRYFNTVEINLTYYRIPAKKTFEGLERQTSHDFQFIVKVNKESTHELKGSTEAMNALHDVLQPLKEAGKLHGFLAQFPYRFKNTPDNRNRLRRLRENAGDVPLFVEFRHFSWNNPAVFEFLKSGGINYCCVDEPRLRGLLPPQDHATGDIGYVRFHGRNAGAWWNSSRGDRYDYSYTKDELAEWIERIREINRKTSKTYLFFNNCHAGHAVRNAKMMAELLKKQFNIDTLLNDLPV